MPDRDEIQRIAAAMHEARPDWPARSLTTFLERNLANKPYRDLLIAGITVASDPKTQTPHLLLEHGAWWAAAQAATGTSTMTAIPGPHDTHCTVYGHEGYRLPCAGCHAEEIAAAPTQLDTPVPAVTERDATQAAAVRAALHNHRTPDARERASNDRGDD